MGCSRRHSCSSHEPLPPNRCLPPPLPPQVFSDDEDLMQDTTAVQLAAGRDIQGIPWELTQYSREGYRVGCCLRGKSSPGCSTWTSARDWPCQCRC